MREPATVVTPPTSKRFLTANGTPARGPGSPPVATIRSIRSASVMAISASTRVKQLSIRSRRAIRSSAPVTTSRADVRRMRMASTIATAERSAQVLTGESPAVARRRRARGTPRTVGHRRGAPRDSRRPPRRCPARAGARGARPSARPRPQSRGAPGSEVGSPAAVLCDLALPLAEHRLAEDAERLLAVGEPNLADAQPAGLREEKDREAGDRHLPHLDGDRRPAPAHADHRRVQVVDGPEAVVRARGRLAGERRAGRDQIAVQLEAA